MAEWLSPRGHPAPTPIPRPQPLSSYSEQQGRDLRLRQASPQPPGAFLACEKGALL